jgi:hypothetical protein
MFSSIFWTAFVPLALVILSIIGERLKRQMRQIHAAQAFGFEPAAARSTAGRAISRHASPPPLAYNARHPHSRPRR